jgi:hypothetical protein
MNRNDAPFNQPFRDPGEHNCKRKYDDRDIISITTLHDTHYQFMCLRCQQRWQGALIPPAVRQRGWREFNRVRRILLQQDYDDQR